MFRSRTFRWTSLPIVIARLVTSPKGSTSLPAASRRCSNGWFAIKRNTGRAMRHGPPNIQRSPVNHPGCNLRGNGWPTPTRRVIRAKGRVDLHDRGVSGRQGREGSEVLGWAGRPRSQVWRVSIRAGQDPKRLHAQGQVRRRVHTQRPGYDLWPLHGFSPRAPSNPQDRPGRGPRVFPSRSSRVTRRTGRRVGGTHLHGLPVGIGRREV